MNINGAWLEDPVTNKPSVSLTLMVVSFIGVVVAEILQIAGKVETVSIGMELFGTCTALYFGRRFTFGGKSYDASTITSIAKDSNEN